MSGHVLALSGGVGGAKLAAGLAAVLSPEDLTIAVNTGDDFEHLGLTICPDIDSVTYAMAGLNDTERGWGVAGETWQAMAMLRALGEEDWFNLGDRDLGMHLARSWRLRAGETLSQVTTRLTQGLGIAHAIVPMSDDPVRTQVVTADGILDFQHYFVREQCRPVARAIRFDGVPGARPSRPLAAALARPDLAAVIVCPSNPYLSVDPILAVDGVREALRNRSVPLVVVSPLVGGKALKGPLGKLLAELGAEANNLAIARHYSGLADHLIIDEADAGDAEGLRALGLSVTITGTVMCEANDRERLARVALAAARIELEDHGAR
ncbi:LPPG:FO 2-phospho-L-lactate transferase [Novosphingobium chloroacetimidivorans]|uniref:LPPG:FO 2-phospho-L-lactate transferase n=1 Tax=Novosphingobium chloroacetimidivorans TaxID=1428314 RepID=A0A7W7NX27_9SPHN|nr:2-phospho-L-lactate transferase [Novosphingobium chloroacetimidivorans]MBB4858994.1 LPPG:FO 2-phospho-L-lactate transferase [Novosphingobium chloroacetimidivorans]